MAANRKTGQSGARTLLIVLAIVTGFWIAAQIPYSLPSLEARTGIDLEDALSWGYQLQNVKASQLPSDTDLLVVDYSRDGSSERAFRKADIERLRQRAKGSRRIILAYISIGEAESYRYYWWRQWRLLGPRWLGRENADWENNYGVRFWDKSWQSIIMKPDRRLFDVVLERFIPWKKSYLDRILEAGFDGVYLDRVDAFADWDEVKPDAANEMLQFVTSLSAYAKKRKPGFLIVPQNGEELLKFKTYRKAIDGIAKEDLFFGIDGDEEKNSSQEIRRSLHHLRLAKRAGLPVLVVEYLDDRRKEQFALSRSADDGFVLHFAERALDQPIRR